MASKSAALFLRSRVRVYVQLPYKKFQSSLLWSDRKIFMMHTAGLKGRLVLQLHGFADPSMNGMLHHSQDYSSLHGGEMYDLAGDDSYSHAPNSVSSSTIPSDLSSPGSTD